jgi:hypothetical protein
MCLFGVVLITEAAREEGLHSMVGYVRREVRVDMDMRMSDLKLESLNTCAKKPKSVGLCREGRLEASTSPDLISSQPPPPPASAPMHAFCIKLTSLHQIAAHASAKSCLDTATSIPSTSHRLIMLASHPPAQYTAPIGNTPRIQSERATWPS